MVELYFRITTSENKDSIFILRNPLYDFTFVHHITWMVYERTTYAWKQ